MPLAPEEKPGRSFATDMRLIREQRGLSPQDIYRATKLPLEIVTLFEQTGLVNHPRYNRVYLRLFVREYARVVGIRESDALEALEATLAGQYRGSLALGYLGIDQGEIAAPSGFESRSTERPSSSAPVGQQDETDGAVEKKDAVPARVPVKETPTRRPVKVRRSGPRVPLGRMLGMVATLVVFGAAIASVVYLYTKPTPTRPSVVQEPNATPADSSLQPAPFSEMAEVGDTMRVMVIARGGKLEPIRKQADSGPETPHWVEEGDTLRFSAVNRFALVGYLTRIDVRVDGHPMPTEGRAEDGRLVFSREDVARILEASPDTTR